VADQEPVAHPCAVCNQHDDHPKHVFVLDVTTGEEVRRHMDCCAPVGCNHCATALNGAGGKKGDALRKHLATAPQSVNVTSTADVVFPHADGGSA
jgi:hypothetical protein